mmetsp:Transcript_157047/g.301345  ORF Transcript_157047/g.301345 Transcript_157047/m.301345 type:complete len:123 (+) Transcript_157047:1-369(+)
MGFEIVGAVTSDGTFLDALESEAELRSRTDTCYNGGGGGGPSSPALSNGMEMSRRKLLTTGLARCVHGARPPSIKSCSASPGSSISKQKPERPRRAKIAVACIAAALSSGMLVKIVRANQLR